MIEIVSANSILVWFAWGFFMATGWTLGSWAMGRLMAILHLA